MKPLLHFFIKVDYVTNSLAVLLFSLVTLNATGKWCTWYFSVAAFWRVTEASWLVSRPPPPHPRRPTVLLHVGDFIGESSPVKSIYKVLLTTKIVTVQRRKRLKNEVRHQKDGFFWWWGGWKWSTMTSAQIHGLCHTSRNLHGPYPGGQFMFWHNVHFSGPRVKEFISLCTRTTLQQRRTDRLLFFSVAQVETRIHRNDKSHEVPLLRFLPGV